MKSIDRQSFAVWVGKFLRADTALGDLARDIYQDNDFPKDATTFAPIWRYMQGTQVEFYVEAFAQYEEEFASVELDASFAEMAELALDDRQELPRIEPSYLPFAQKIIETRGVDRTSFRNVMIRDSQGEDITNFIDPYGVIQTLLGMTVKKLEPQEPADQGVYFARTTSRIKIGFSNTVKKRIRSLQTGCPEPIFLMGSIPGDMTLEREWHSRFAHLRQKGEWFNAAPELEDAITEALRAPCP